ncbi:MAG: tetratricopeptide repeat protein [Leptolyngbya sp. SIOISBB]|nr:tetratricopeptide repeat protein [Leptolyngbya sp. SIOISBB]
MVVTTVPVLPLNSQVLPGHNQETYQRLQTAVQAIPPHQIWVATCDDLPLQRQLAATLEESLQSRGKTVDTQRLLDIEQPNLVQQIQSWLSQFPTERPPLLQILGIEQLTHCGSDTQYRFLRSLHQLWPLWPQFDVSILLWMPRPWLKQIRREVPNLGRSVFEFMGEPTPITTIPHQPNFQVAFSTVREWQFLGQVAPTRLSEDDLEIRPPSPPVVAESAAVDHHPGDEVAESEVPTFSEALWHQLQDDLSDFESAPTNADSAILDNASAGPVKRPQPPESPSEDVGDGRSRQASHQTAAEPLPAAAWPQVDTDLLADWAIAFELRDRVQSGDQSASTLETAIQAYESLQPEQLTTPQRTEVLNDLGSLYWLWAQQATAIDPYFQRLMQSREIYEAALSPISPQTGAGVLNRLHSNLGSVYSLLAAYQDPIHYLSQAVRAFHRALQYAPVETMPDEYALLQTHLGTAYWSLSQQSQEPTHLHRAIAAYQEALQQSQPQHAPKLYAQLQNNLGIALWSLARHERPVFLLEQAIGAYRTALAYRTLEGDPTGYAATQNNLGTAYWDLGGHCEERLPAQQQTWRQAIIAYESAISAVGSVQQEPLSFDVWAAHHSVGVVYDQLAITLAPQATVQQPLLTRATMHYTEALMGWQAMESASTDTALQALIRNLQLQARFLGIEMQQRSLSQIPADWLPDIWRKL